MQQVTHTIIKKKKRKKSGEKKEKETLTLLYTSSILTDLEAVEIKQAKK